MRDNHDLWRKRIHIPPYLSGDLWRDRAQVMAILSDCTSCKVVDQVCAISHTSSPAEMTRMRDRGFSLRISLVYLKLFKASHYMQSWVNHGQLNHTHSKCTVDLCRVWRINLRPRSGIRHMQEWSARRLPVWNTFDLFACSFYSPLSNVAFWQLLNAHIHFICGSLYHESSYRRTISQRLCHFFQSGQFSPPLQ